MNKNNLLVAALLAAVVLWWLFGPHVTATVTVPQDQIRVRYKGPLEAAPTEGVDPLRTLAENEAVLSEWNWSL